jgi:hypothetical protein
MSCCIALDNASIYVLDAYANGAVGYGYGNNYGAVYGNTALNSISAFDVGRELGVGEATLNIETVNINSSINNFNAYSGRKLKSVNLGIKTECWSDENLRLFLGAELSTITASTTTEYLYRTYIPADTAIVKNGALSNVTIVNTSTAQALIAGVDYMLLMNRIVFLKDLNIATSLMLTYTVSAYTIITPFKEQNIDFKALMIAGRNIADNTFLSFKFPKVKINVDTINYDIFADEFLPLNLTAKCFDGLLAGMNSPAPFVMLRG